MHAKRAGTSAKHVGHCDTCDAHLVSRLFVVMWPNTSPGAKHRWIPTVFTTEIILQLYINLEEMFSVLLDTSIIQAKFEILRQCQLSAKRRVIEIRAASSFYQSPSVYEIEPISDFVGIKYRVASLVKTLGVRTHSGWFVTGLATFKWWW